MTDTADDIALRSAQAQDLDALLALEKRCFESDRLSRRSFKRWLDSDQSVFLVAEKAGALVGYCLVLFHRGTRLARLYSLAVDPQWRGRGLAARLIAAGEQGASASGRLEMRLEVSSLNTGAIRLYETLGYRRFGLYHDYYEDHSDALRYQKRIRVYAGEGSSHGAIPWLAQTTHFTCGPASLMMAMTALDQNYQASQMEELRIWREATTIFMTSGHGGCHPMGLAAAAAKRGFRVEAWVSQEGPLFLDGVRDEHKKTVMASVHEDYRQALVQAEIPVHYREVRQEDLIAAFQQGAVPLILISTWRMDSKKAPHWVVMSGYDDDCIYVHDPDPDDNSQTALDCQFMPLARSDFEHMTAFGRSRLRTAVMVYGQEETPRT
ncbi:GNAT family N-acetyltransferase/peptidase C39 family protein [Marinimicrobium alkaliphilum]|uniref:GNAT family N-acetyltransferase/peptidase C39 family protein n=1 Tax=Marinimicrobium alkaliphilum TaxID=2202654 RepID=UPI000DBA45ED|nr:GNAT family N-acetyltransferase/peptidase C39 family protein [Marinimicrobium alkaliphilum]